MIELPPFRVPGIRVALLHTFDRAKIFVKKAGTIILAISLILWALSYYPKSTPPAGAVTMNEQAAQFGKNGDTIKANELHAEAARLTVQNSLQNSFAGKIGHVIEPVIAPLGYDWQSGIGMFSSFAAREAVGRHADFQHGDVREPAGVLHPRGAMSVHHGGCAARDEQLEMAVVSNRLHDW